MSNGSSIAPQLRILFIVPSLEPGKDGVGDYTLRLAQALRERGVVVGCVSLADRFVKEELFSDLNVPAIMLRLPNSIPWKDRIISLQRVIDGFFPDLVSLQYVPYGFEQMGLPFQLSKRLSSLKGTFRWHVMFHELWIGWGEHSPVRQRLVGYLQSRIVKMIDRRLHPSSTTTIPVYQRLLAGAGIASDLLPLFSNIPQFPGTSALDATTASFFKNSSRSDWYLLGSFGAIYSDFSREWWLEDLVSRCESAGLKAGFWFIGGNSGKVSLLAEALRHRFGSKLGVLDLGVRNPEEVSGFLQSVDAGIVTTPPEIIGKSGVVAAMREHGLNYFNSHLLSSGRETIDPLQQMYRNHAPSVLEKTALAMMALASKK